MSVKEIVVGLVDRAGSPWDEAVTVYRDSSNGLFCAMAPGWSCGPQRKTIRRAVECLFDIRNDRVVIWPHEQQEG